MAQNTTIEKIGYYLLVKDCENLEFFIKGKFINLITDTDEKKFIGSLIDYYNLLHKIPNVDELVKYNEGKPEKELLGLKYNSCKSAITENVGFKDLIEVLKKEYKLKSISNLYKNTDFSRPDALNNVMDEIDKIQNNIDGDETDVVRTNVYENTDKVYEQILANKNKQYMTTGLDSLDKALNGGFEKGSLYLFFGGTGSGKSRLLLHCANRAITTGFHGIYLTLELTNAQIMYFYISKVSGLSYNQISHGEVEDVFLKDIMDLIQRNENPLTITENIGMIPFNFIEDEIELYKKTHKEKLDFIIVDYIDHLTMKNFKNRWDELGVITLMLKKMAKKENIVIITAQQQNRSKVEEGEAVDTRYVAGSNKIPAICDFVANIKRGKKMEENVKLDMFICKNRFGESDLKINLLADFDHLEFKDVLIPKDYNQTNGNDNNDGGNNV